jgi:DNA polymerase-3 subunit alpha
MSFVHLHTHSELSRLDGASRIPDLARTAKVLDMPAVAVTDHGHSFGAMKLYEACKQEGIKPIVGAELYLAPEDMTKRERVTWGEIEENGKRRVTPGGNTHLTVLAQNAVGLRNLFKLQAKANLTGFYGYPRVDMDALESHAEGLIVLSGCAGSALSTRLRLNQVQEAKQLAGRFADAFPGRYFVEIMHHGIEFEDDLNRGLIELAHSLGLPVVATNDSHYTTEEDARVHDALLCLQTGAKISDSNRFKFSGTGFYLKSAAEMALLFQEAPGAIRNTLRVADMVESYDEVFRHRDLMPEPKVGLSLMGEAHAGLQARGDLHLYDEYINRLEYEGRTLEELGYAGYILVISDLVRWAKDQGILVGPARGSAGGSLVCYALGITDIDPLEHGLVFERFLNKDRVSPPDVDIDFQEDRRDEVLRYAVETYGLDKVSQIITLGTIKTRAAVKDAARVLGREAKEGQRLANLVPPLKRGRQVSLEDVPEIGDQDSETYALALNLEGMVRNFGIHAAGVIISPEPLAELIPVKKGPNDEFLISGFEQGELEKLGLNKIDVLGLKNLTTIKKTLDFING